MADQQTESAPPTGPRAVLEAHVEDLDAPGACSCGWELWDGSIDECRSAFRYHVAAYLKEDAQRVSRLADAIFGPRSYPPAQEADRG